MGKSTKWTSDMLTSMAEFYNSNAAKGITVTAKRMRNELEAISDHVFTLSAVQSRFGHFKSFAAEMASMNDPTEADWRSTFHTRLGVREFRFSNTQKEIILTMGDYIRANNDKEAAISSKLAKARGKKRQDESKEEDVGAGKWLTAAVSAVVKDVFTHEIQKACRRAIAITVADAVSNRVLRGIAEYIQPHIADIIAPQMEHVRVSRLQTFSR
jgi:hypothetical protein